MDDEPQNPEAIIEPLREQSARNEEMGFPHPVVHLAAAEAAVREGFAAGRAALPDPPRDCTCGEFCSGCGGRRAVTPDEGWSPGIDDPGPPALGDIDTGEGWYQT